VPLFFAATFSVANFYMVCQRELFPGTWMSRLKYLPFLMSIGIGLCINNARAVIEALARKESGEFARTPKYGIEQESDDWQGKKYHQISLPQPLIELSLGLYFTATVFYALANGIYGTLPFLMLFQIGFLYTGLLSIVQQYAGDPVVLNTQVAPTGIQRVGASTNGKSQTLVNNGDGVGVSKAKHLGLVRSNTELALLLALKQGDQPAAFAFGRFAVMRAPRRVNVMIA